MSSVTEMTYLHHGDSATEDDVPVFGRESGWSLGDDNSHQSHQFNVVRQYWPLGVTHSSVWEMARTNMLADRLEMYLYYKTVCACACPFVPSNLCYFCTWGWNFIGVLGGPWGRSVHFKFEIEILRRNLYRRLM